MKVTGIGTLYEFSNNHADIREQLKSWLSETKKADWKRSHDIKQKYANASFLADNTVVFNIKGNDYRLVTKVNYKNQIVIIKRIGTHAEYSRWRL